MWTTENRRRYDRDELRYPSDLTDEVGAGGSPDPTRPGVAGDGARSTSGRCGATFRGICRRAARGTTIFSAGTTTGRWATSTMRSTKNAGNRSTARSVRLLAHHGSVDACGWSIQPTSRIATGGLLVLASLFGLYPLLKKLFADAGYQGPQFRKQLARMLPRLSVEIVKRSDTAKGGLRGLAQTLGGRADPRVA
jgi:hypothetical protein